jgi:hypothetical protein
MIHIQGRIVSEAKNQQLLVVGCCWMEEVCSSETTVNFYQTIQRRIPQDTFHTARRENPKSNTVMYMVNFIRTNISILFYKLSRNLFSHCFLSKKSICIVTVIGR